MVDVVREEKKYRCFFRIFILEKSKSGSFFFNDKGIYNSEVFFLFNSFLKFFSFNPNNRRRRSKNREKKRERERGVDEEVFSLREIVTFIKSYYSSSSLIYLNEMKFSRLR